MPLVRGVVFAAIGFAVGALVSFAITNVTGEPHGEPLIVLGYVFAVIGWLMGVGMWKVWGREWFSRGTEDDPEGRWERYLRFNTDHKVIGVQYLASFAVVFLLGGLLSMLLRAELYNPELSLFSRTDYNTTMSLHGIMMIAVAVAAVMGGFANFILPLIIGAKDVAFPRVNAMSYWIVPPVVVLLLLTPFFGGFDTGWTAYPPLATQGPTGALLFELAFLTFGISSILGGLNFIATVITQRAPGMSWDRLPIFAWSVLAAAIISLTATQWVAYGLLMIIFERIFNMVFFSPPGGNALLYEHVFWFYSHPAVYIMILPAFGIELEIISHFARKPIFAYRWVVRALFLIVGLSFVVWAHHLFTSGMNENLHGPFMILTELISIPTGVVFLSALGTVWRSKMRLKVPMLFALGMIFNFAIGGLTGIFLADVVTDISLQDTYFIVAHFHYTIMGGEIFAIMAAGYYWFPKITGRMYNETLGRIHFVLTFLLFNLTFLAMFIPGSLGMNRRIAEYPSEFGTMNLVVSILGIALGVAFIPWVYNILNSWIRGVKAPDSPWGAKTLEWQTTSPPPHENFAEMPIVSGDPYGYGDDTVIHSNLDDGLAEQPRAAEGD
jgi:cytochrome c oxidase subunit 1